MTAPTLVCPHGLGSPASCFDCMEDGYVPPLPSRSRARHVAAARITARLDGECSSCGGRVCVGDEIGMVEGLGWVGGCCLDG